MNRKSILLTFFCCLSLFTRVVAAEEEENESVFYLSDPGRHTFYQVMGGLNHSMSENVRFYPFLQAERPAVVVGYGRYFYPQFGMRVTAGWLNHISFVDKNTLNNIPYGYESNYTFQMGQVFLDGLLDLGSIIFGPAERNSRLSFFLGFGYIRTFGFSDMATKWTERHNMLVEKYGEEYRNTADETDAMGNVVRIYAYPVDTKLGNYLAAHFGFLYSYRINKYFDINIEASFNGTDDAYNGVRCRRVYDSWVNGLAGVSYRFNKRQKIYRYSSLVDYDEFAMENLPEEIVDTVVVKDPTIKIVEEVVELEETIQTVVQFYIDKDWVSDDQKENVYSVAAFMKSHPTLRVRIIGYADIQTAYPEYNLKLSKRRAESVYKILTEECGIDPNRLVIDWKGDTEQPYELVNEWNRAVIFKLEK